MTKTDAEIDREIAQSERLARLFNKMSDGLPAAMVMNALAMCIAHGVFHHSVDKDVDATMALLTDTVRIEFDGLHAEAQTAAEENDANDFYARGEHMPGVTE